MAAVSHPQSHAGLGPWNKDQDTVYALNRGDLTKEQIATGTGIWLRDMAKLLPSSPELRGIDMDTTKFPPLSDLPPVGLEV
ncbi:uncharacterized protein CLUP02_11816 [Colletotrichum lupini]|uniref:Uncharacterized protein n=1 Tax=Colletotrichum lupini TaxID=145971 RepID=A0A9Q8WK67_9PEZI|nr:uncharacterized protein CLUP02_11816 [Colletotrichum lupini]UQC86316.1 hypothetical protein CLUP02_11816 [Colletotrichum lupini]